METEYRTLYNHYATEYGPNTCIFYKVGKFYEMYDSLNPETGEGNTSMQSAVELLNIQLSTKQEHQKTTFFAGVPEQSLHKYAAVLTRHNWTVVVCDQTKDAKGKVTGRPVVRILSPGTHSEIASTETCYVAYLWMEERNWQQNEPPAFGITFFDITTGITTGFQDVTTGTADIWAADSLVQAIQIYNPREIVVGWRGTPLSCPTEPVVRSRLGGTAALLHLRNVADQGGFETPLVRDDFLRRLYAPKTMIPILDYLHIRGEPLTERSLIGLLRFMEDHFASALDNLRAFEPWVSTTHCHLGNNTLTQLNMTGAQSSDCVLGLFSRTLTAPGRRAMRTRLLTPIFDTTVLNTRYEKIEFFMKTTPTAVERALRQLSDFPRILRRIATFTVNAADILQLDTTLGRLQELAVPLRETCFRLPDDTFAQLLRIRVRFAELFDTEKAKRAEEDSWFFTDAAAPNTARVEKEIAEARAELVARLHALEEWAGLPLDSLRIETGRETQIYSVVGNKKELNLLKTALATKTTVPDTTDKVYRVNGSKTEISKLKTALTPVVPSPPPLPNLTVVLKKTGGGSVESPAFEALHGKMLRLRAQLNAAAKEEIGAVCIRFLAADATAATAAATAETSDRIWMQLEEWVAELDMSLTMATVSKQRAFVRPLLENGDEATVYIQGLRHPLIENTASRTPYVQHTVELGGNQTGWLVYGMNASGKSSLMKAVGIAVLLAQCGCYVPAIRMKLTPFRAVLTRILNQDNLWAGLSSFAVEMTELRDILVRADRYSIVLGDELCSGTESISATALVAAGVTHLLKKSARFIFATHLHGLLDIPSLAGAARLGVWHLKVSYDPVRDVLVFDRTLQPGAGSSLYGIEVARALHLPPDFLETAITLRRGLVGQKTEEELAPSAWNASMVRRLCSVCGRSTTDDLEVHHIRPRAEAAAAAATAAATHFSDHSERDAASNLVVVCKECHDRHHSGRLVIGAATQTSVGVIRRASLSTAEQPVEPDNTREIILNTLRKYPNLPLKRIVYELEQNHQITVTEASLRKYRKTASTLPE